GQSTRRGAPPRRDSQRGRHRRVGAPLARRVARQFPSAEDCQGIGADTENERRVVTDDERRVTEHRAFYADLVTASGRSTSRVLHGALQSTRREDFVGAGPWEIFAGGRYLRTPTDDAAFIYQDVVVRLQGDINNGQPTLHALCLGMLGPQPGERVVHIGAGTGYYTALLAQLV